jgi:hypothetical protein
VPVTYSDISTDGDDAESIAAEAAAFAAAAGIGDDSDDEDDGQPPPEGGEYRRTASGFRFHIPAYICDAHGDPDIVRHPPDGGVRTVTLKQPTSSSTTEAASTSRPKARKPGRQERLRRRRQAARAAHAESPGGDTTLVPPSSAVPSQVKPAARNEHGAQPDRGSHADDASSADAADAAGLPQHESNLSNSVSTAVPVSEQAATSSQALSSSSVADVTDMDVAEPVTAVPERDQPMDTDATDGQSVAPERHPTVANILTVDGVPVTVILAHAVDKSPCTHDLYCPRGRHPYCTECDVFMYDQVLCSHLRDYRDELDFDC